MAKHLSRRTSEGGIPLESKVDENRSESGEFLIEPGRQQLMPPEAGPAQGAVSLDELYEAAGGHRDAFYEDTFEKGFLEDLDEGIAQDKDDDEVPLESVPPSWNRCAADYECFAQAITRPFAEDAARLVKIRKGDRILDVATGTGEFAMAAAVRGALVLATDFSRHMLDLLARIQRERAISGITPALMDGQNLRLASETFDVAGSLFGLVFFPDPARGLAEMHRILRPGGQVVIGTWASPARVELMRIVGEAVMETGAMPTTSAPPSNWALHSSQEALTRLIRDAGFQSVHAVELTHVWTFESVEDFASAVLRMTPAWMEFQEAMTVAEQKSFAEHLSERFRSRQGTGPYAVTAQGLLGVGTKPRAPIRRLGKVARGPD